MHDAPLVAAVTGGFVVALLVLARYAALAIVAVVVLHAQRRSREVAFLRTLGLTDGQLAGLTIVEHGLPVVLALGVGVGLGLRARLAARAGHRPRRVQPPWRDGHARGRLGLDRRRRPRGRRGRRVAVAISVLVARRLDLGHALRIGEQ